MNAGEIRKTIRTKRRALTSAQQQTAAENLAALISQQNFFLRAKRIGIYLANDGEIDPSLLMGIALNAKKACYLPIIHPLQFNRLYFGEYREGDQLKANRFGILEPQFNATTIAPLWIIGFNSSATGSLRSQWQQNWYGWWFLRSHSGSFRQPTAQAKPDWPGPQLSGS